MAQATICIGIDFDAVSIWLHDYKALNSPTKHSRGIYGAEVAVPRMLDLFDRFDMSATFFTPGHTIDSFPETVADVKNKGHDIQHHGWSHTNPSEFESREAEKEDIERGIESIRDMTGEKPSGYRSPAWDFSSHTLDIIQELDFAWDSSQMGHDFMPYYLCENPNVNPDKPYERGEKTNILEIPVSWNRDDWPPFQYVSGANTEGGAPDEKQIFEMWREQFDWMYDHLANGVFPLTVHPQVIGQPPRLRYFEQLLAYIQEKPNVEFQLFDDIANRY